MAENHLTTSSEQWKPVVGYEGYYEVSDHGRVRSMEREVTRRNGVKMSVQQRVLKLIAKPDGYLVVGLSKDGVIKMRLVHRLVLEAFVGPCPEGMVTCHYDDIPENNHISNLRWDTEGANALDKVRNGNHNHAKKTHCRHGHEYSPENTYVTKNGWRYCKACDKKRKGIIGPSNSDKTHCKRGHEFSPENTHITKSGERSCRECNALRARSYRAKRRAKELQEQ